jgi:hypothetical protein
MQRVVLALIGLAGAAIWVGVLWWAFGPFVTGDTWTKICYRDAEQAIRVFAVQQTLDGGYILAGFSWTVDPEDLDMYVVKLDTKGNEQWSREFGGEGPDEACAVQQTADGGYILAGSTSSFGDGGEDVYLVKIDGNGNEQWSGTFGGKECDSGSAVLQTADGDYIVAGNTSSFGAGGGDVYLVKIDANGSEQWSGTFGGKEYDSGSAVLQTADGGYTIAGHTSSFGAGESDVYLLKVDANGDEQWSKALGGDERDQVYAMQQTSDGGCIVAGATGPLERLGLNQKHM